MNYSIKVREKKELFDAILSALGAQSIDRNDDFLLDPLWNTEWHVEYDVVPKGREFLPLRIIIDEDFIRFDINDFAEAMVWTGAAISESKSDLIAFITNLFSSHIILEGIAGYAELSFVDSKGGILDKMILGNRVNKLLGKFVNTPPKKDVFKPIYGS